MVCHCQVLFAHRIAIRRHEARCRYCHAIQQLQLAMLSAAHLQHVVQRIRLRQQGKPSMLGLAVRSDLRGLVVHGLVIRAFAFWAFASALDRRHQGGRTDARKCVKQC
jgi:hypothetical protein